MGIFGAKFRNGIIPLNLFCMTTTFEPDETQFQKYFTSISQQYGCWGNFYTLTDTLDQQSQDKAGFSSFDSPFDFGLMVEKVEPKQDKQEKRDRLPVTLPVLEALSKYAAEHVLLIGKPGSGKSTALLQVLYQEAEKAQHGNSSIPVLVELRSWKPQTNSVIELIQKVFRKNQLRLELEKIENLLFDGKLLVLFDGLNELVSDEGWSLIKDFREEFSETPMVFTSREVSSYDLRIQNKLEIQPLKGQQIDNFVSQYLGDKSNEMLRQLNNKQYSFAETPLLLWMLCRVYAQHNKIPNNLGEAFQEFSQLYDEKLKPSVLFSGYDNYRQWSGDLLQILAFEMMQGLEPRKPQLEISHKDAENILSKFLKNEGFDKPRDYAKNWLEDLLEHHLIQISSNKEIEFCHQLLQEYYAAEYLLTLLPELSNAKLQRDYLNLLKWTESIAIALALLEDEALAVRVVQLALDVDLMLGARLAGEVKERFQQKTVGLVLGLKVHQRLKIELLGMTRSEFARSPLLNIWNNHNYDCAYAAAEALCCVGYDEAMSELDEAQDAAFFIMQQEQADLDMYECCEDYFIFERVAEELEKINSSDVPFLTLFKLLNDEKLIKKENSKSSQRRNCKAIEVLGENLFNQVLSLLFSQILNNKDFRVRYYAALVLGNLGSSAEAKCLIKAIKDENHFVRSGVVEALGKIGHPIAIFALIEALKDEKAFVRSRVAKALGKFRYHETIDALIKALKDEKSFVRCSAVQSLSVINSEQVLEHLIKAYNDADLDVRWNVIRALGEFAEVNPSNELIIHTLIDALDDKDTVVSCHAAYALQRTYDEVTTDMKQFDEQCLIYCGLKPLMQKILLVATYEIKNTILKIQERCKFYNHEIFHSPLIEDETENKSQSTTTNNFYAPVGNFNAGDVNINGNQIGLQDGKSIQ
jgi:hypothetical protein